MTRKKKIIIALSIAGGIPLTLGTLYGGLRLGAWIYNVSTGYYAKEYPRIEEGRYVLSDSSSYKLTPSGPSMYPINASASFLDASYALSGDDSQSAFPYLSANSNGTNCEERTIYFSLGEIQFETHCIEYLKIDTSFPQEHIMLRYHYAKYRMKLDGSYFTSTGSISYSVDSVNTTKINFTINVPTTAEERAVAVISLHYIFKK